MDADTQLKTSWVYCAHHLLGGRIFRMEVWSVGAFDLTPHIRAYGWTLGQAERRVTKKVHHFLQGRRRGSWVPEDDEA